MATGAKATKKSSSKRTKDKGRAPGAASSQLPAESVAAEADTGKPFYVVGLGASAGGIEALSELFEAVPKDTGMAFILVQHLAPTYESMLPEILSRKAIIPVTEAAEGLVIKPNCVYVIPPNRYMTIKQGQLKLAPRDETAGRFLPIDYFLNSLAEDRKNMAIGVILSGTANDGTQGLKAIKMEGGVTFAQDELSAKYPDMPKNAIAAGIVDFVLTPMQIATELARIGKHPLIVFAHMEDKAEQSEQAELAEQAGSIELFDIFRMLRVSANIDFSNYKLNTIRRRISRRMVVTKVETIAEYADYLKKNAAELDTLAGDLLINVTSFFRDPEIFDLLKQSIIPELLKQKGAAPLRVWVPGCSTGEEAYSLAICMLECCAEANVRVPVQIFATDISEWAVERARAGIYPESIAAEVSKERLRRFFTKVESGYQVSKAIRDVCIFARQDLAKDPPFSRMDLISCRNVLIYLAPVLQKKIIPTFHYALNPDGALILGPSETSAGFADLFMLMDKKYKIYRKKQAAYRVSPDFQLTGYDQKQMTGKKPLIEIPRDFDVQKEADRIILGSYAPAAVLINEHMDILQFRGKTGAFIEPMSGAASLNLMKMLREGLLLEVRALVLQAKKQNIPVHKRDVIVRSNGEKRRVDLDVLPIRPPEQNKPHFFLVIFRDASTVLHAEPAKPEPANRKRELRDLEILRTDLQTTREYLQATLEEKDSMSEEFRAAVEEIQSSNEELQSTNEELETAKEELQSTNEELITVNEELQNRNNELTQVNNDLSNLLSNVSFPVVMLTTDLRIRRFTPMAEKLLNFIPSDVGRPLTDLRLRIDFPNLEGMIHSVIDTLAPNELEVQDTDGQWYLLRLRPYLTMEKKIDGVVMALVDISDMKQHLEEVRQAQVFADAIIEAIPGPFLVLSTDLKVEQANHVFYESFLVSPQETEGNFLYNLGNGQWNIPELRQLLEKIIKEGGRFERYEVSHDFPALGKKHMLLNGRKIYSAEGKEKILLAIEEKTAKP